MRYRCTALRILLFVLILSPQLAVAQEADLEAERMQKLMDRNCQIHTVALLDSLLCFTPEQWDKTLQLVSDQWDPAWNEEMQTIYLRTWGSDRINTVEEINFDDLLGSLSPNQVSALKDIRRLASVDFVDMLLEDRSESLEDRLAKNKEALIQLTEMKLDELREVCDMTEKQAELIRVARNGMVSKTAAGWRETIEAYQKNREDEAIQGDVMKLMRGSLLSQCTSQGVWEKTLEKVFDDEQLGKLQDREAMRTELLKHQFVSDLVIFWLRNSFDLDSKQFTEMVDLVCEDLSMDYAWEMKKAEKHFASLPDEKFKKILDEDQWKKMEAILRRMR